MQSLKTQLQDLIKSTPVLVFSKTYCPYCIEAKNIFNKANVQYQVQELDVMSEGSAIQNAL
jgi:glutaredoxin